MGKRMETSLEGRGLGLTEAGGSCLPRTGSHQALPDPHLLTEDTTSQSCSGKEGCGH